MIFGAERNQANKTTVSSWHNTAKLFMISSGLSRRLLTSLTFAAYRTTPVEGESSPVQVGIEVPTSPCGGRALGTLMYSTRKQETSQR